MQTEYGFIINAEQLRKLADAAIANRLARFDRYSKRMDVAFCKLIPLLALLSLPPAGLVLYMLQGRFRIEEALGLLIAGGICYAAWQLCGTRLKTHLQGRRTAIRKAVRNVLARFLETSARSSLQQLEGAHQLRIERACLTIQSPRNRVSRIPWDKLSRIRETDDFYLISTPVLGRLGLCHLVAKHSTMMKPDEYERGLRQVFERVPTDAWK
ncbi:hypothetical protein D3C81_1131750 [compost metagenome]